MTNRKTPPKLKVKDVLIDLDNTITFSDDPSIVDGNAFLDILVRIMMEKDRLPREEARAKIQRVCDPATTCLFNILPVIGITRETYWGKIQEHLSRYLRLYQDSAVLLKALRARNIQTFPATTNSRMAILSKLAVFGLADLDGSPYFKEILGGSEVFPEGKSSAGFFLALIKRFHLDPKRTLMIGDDPQADLAYARAAGIEQVVLPCRSQKEPLIVKEDGGIYVKSLELVLEMID